MLMNMKIKDGFLLHQVAGQTVVLPTGGELDLNVTITLNETGRFLWERLQNETDRESLVQALLAEFDVDAPTALGSSKIGGGQTVRYLPFREVRMLPMLRQGKDAVEVGPIAGKLKKYDLPVYQYPSGKYVMHRIVGVKQDYYVCLGDNTYEYERIRPEQILAVVVAFRRGQKRISVDSLGYQLYSRI